MTVLAHTCTFLLPHRKLHMAVLAHICISVTLQTEPLLFLLDVLIFS